MKIINNNFHRKDIDLIKTFNCNESWPICLFDFTFKNKFHEQQTMKSKYNLSHFVIQDYFYSENDI